MKCNKIIFTHMADYKTILLSILLKFRFFASQNIIQSPINLGTTNDKQSFYGSLSAKQNQRPHEKP